MKTEAFFAPCPRGLEAPLAAEMTALGATYVTATDGGVGFAGPLELACHANLESRLASRFLWRVAHGRYRNEDDLYALAHAVEWERHFNVERTLRVDVAATRSPLASLEFATLKVKDAVCDRFRAVTGIRPSVDKQRPDARVHAFLGEREATLYLDTSGEALFKRGYRRDADVAPLRENLAAGLIALSGWTPDAPLLDPMCGSGTIAIEAALIAANRAPGLGRTFGFQKLAWYDGPAWQRIRQRAHDRVRPAPATPAIFASDVDPRVLELCRRNLAAAGVAGFVDVATADVVAACRPRARGRSDRQSAVRRAARIRRGADGPVSAARRRAEAAVPRLDRVSPVRRHAAAEADRIEAFAAYTAVQRRDRMPPLPFRNRGRSAPARDRVGRRRRRPSGGSRRRVRRRVDRLRESVHCVRSHRTADPR